MGASWMAFANHPVWGGRFRVLLQAAKDLCDNDHPEAAIVTAQTACEVCTEILLTETSKSRGIDFLSSSIDRLLPSYNLGNDRVRKLYEAVTNDLVTSDSARWSKFKQHVSKRNAVVHDGETATQAEANASIAVVEDLVEHLVQHYYATWP